jgi:uncharacterized membrane protein
MTETRLPPWQGKKIDHLSKKGSASMEWNKSQEQTPRLQDYYDGYTSTSGYRSQAASSESAFYEQQGQYQQGESPSIDTYQEPTYARRSYMPPVGDSSGSTSMRSESGVAGLLCYVLFWLSGLLFLLFERHNRFVRFHALQSLIFFGGINVLSIALITIISENPPFFLGFAIFFYVILNIVALVGWILAMVNASKGRYYKLPIVGDFVERYISRDPTLK